MSRWSVSQRRSAAGAAASREFAIQDSLGYLVTRAARLMARQLGDALRPAGVGIGQWAVLMFLWAHDGMSQAELSKVVAIEPPTMVRTLDRMVRDGLVTRVPDAKDGRVTRIHLTARGRALRDELVPLAVKVNETNLGRLTASEGRTLQRLLAKLVDEPGPAA